MFTLPSSWTWDFWLADDGEQFHLFYLKASRALHDPDRRHWRASIGHAVSTDLRSWHEVADAVVAADSPAFDDMAVWTGSVVRHDDGRWRMFYTGVSRAEGGSVQRIGSVVSADLYTWHREAGAVPLEAVVDWYEKRADQAWPDEAWRDPWVLRDPADPDWHMLVTARGRTGTTQGRGVVGHATSHDLLTWTVQPPLTQTGHGFGQLEVLEVACVEDSWVLLFSCLGSELDPSRRADDGSGGVWVAPAKGPLGPFEVADAYRLTDEQFYAGRLVQDRMGAWWLLAFHHTAADGSWGGHLSDPMAVSWLDGRLRARLVDETDVVTAPVESAGRRA